MVKKYIIKCRDVLVRIKNSVFGNKKYNTFVVITRSRTGSNLLMSLLNSHPNIVAKGELFRSLDGKSCKETWVNTFVNMPKQIKYFGFKIFYYHPLDSNDKEIWDYIKEDKSIRLIHLTRDNMLKTVVSREIADRTNTWTNKWGKNIQLSDKQVEIDIDYCLNEFEITKESENSTKNEYNREFFIELTYEDLIKDNQKMMNEVFNFLELKETKVKSGYKKQNKEKLEELIVNYKDLYEAIKRTKWSYLLDLD